MRNEKDKGRKMSDKAIIIRLMKYASKFKKEFIIAFIMMVVMVGLDLVGPLLMGESIKTLSEKNIVFTRIIVIVVLYAAILVVSALIQYIQGMILQKAGQNIILEVRQEVFEHIEKLSIAQINKTPVGKLVTRVTNDTGTLNELFTDVLINLVKNFMTVIGVIIFMFICDAKLALYVLAMSPLVIGLTIVFRIFARRAYREVRHNISSINASLSENLSGMKITQVYNAEEKQYNEFKRKNNRLKRSSLRQIIIFALFRPAIYVLYLLTVILVLWFGAKDAIMYTNVAAIASLVIFYQYINKFFEPIQQLAEQFNVLQSSFASSERIFEILDTPSEIVDAEDAIDMPNIRGDIEFKHVWFCYEKDDWILKDVSFKIKAKEVVAFVGATGSGKTTILSLLVRNYDIQSGEILVDGVDVRKIKLDSLRSGVGQMLQDVFLFSGTVLSNIKMDEESITDEDVVKACEYVGANHFIERLKDGYKEEVRERGNNFSSGERQLLSFARTVVHKPSIMILDEATANIDTETEVLIQASLEKMMNIGTMLMVAHRLSTIQHADKIIVLGKGEIIEEGTHQELLQAKGAYYSLYKLQYEKGDNQ